MACINRSHPEFKRLAAQSELNPAVLAANMAIWMEENNTTLFPTIEELKIVNKPEEKYFSYSPIKQLGFKFNANTAGFMPKNVDYAQVTNAARKVGLSVHKSAVGTWFFKNQRGMFINPHKYQVESKETRLPDAELNDKLKEWTEKHGIKVEAVEEMIERLGPDDRFQGVVGVASMLERIISIDPSREKMDTLAEEVSHFATAILKDDISFKKALENIEKTEIYKQVKIDYKDRYIREEDFKKEAVDKLLAKAILENFESEGSTTGIMPYIKAIFNKFWKWVNTNIKGTDAETDIKNELYPLAKRILSGDYLGTVDNTESVVSNQAEYYQTEESEEKPEKKETDDKKSETDIAIDFLNNTILNLRTRLAALENATNKQDKAADVQQEIQKIRKSLQENELRAGIKGVVNSAEKEIDQIIAVLEDHNKTGKLDSDTYEDVEDFVDSYMGLFSKFKNDMAYYDFNKTLQQQMIEAMQGLQQKFSVAVDMNSILTLKSSKKTLVGANTNVNGEKIDPDFNELETIKGVGSDISPWRLHAGNWKQASSSILRSVWKIVYNSNAIVKKKAVATAEKLLQAQVLMEKDGFKVSELTEKTFDKNGKRTVPTQFLIRRADWGTYLSERIKHRKNLLEKYDYEEWADFKEDVKNKKLSKDKLESISQVESSFKAKNPTKPVFDNEGNITSYEPSAVNPDFSRLMENDFVRNYYDTLLEVKDASLLKMPKKYRTDYYRYLLPGIRAQFIEKLYRPDVSLKDNIKQVLHESVFRDQDDTQFGESSELGNKMIPIYFNIRFDDTRQVSTDLTKSFTLYAEMAENFYQKNKIAGDIWAITNRVKDQKYKSSVRGKEIEGAASNVYKALNVVIDRDIYGIQDLDYAVKMPENKITKRLKIDGKELSLSKAAKKLTSYISTNNLALSPFTSTAGYLKGTVDSVLEDQIARYTTVESKNVGRKKFFSNLPEVMAESVKKKQTNKMHLQMRRHNVIDINSLLRNTERSKLTSNLASSHNLFINYKLADYGIKGRIMLAVHDNQRLVNGEFIDKDTFRKRKRADKVEEKTINEEWKSYSDKTYDDAFEVVDNQIKIKEEYKEFIDDKLDNKITGIIEHVSNTVDGQMGESDKGALSRQILGEFLLMHRGWFINMLDSRFMKRNVNMLTEKEDIGYYPAVWEFFKKDMFSDGMSGWYKSLSGSKWKEMREKDPAKAKGVKRAFLDLVYLNLVALLAGLVNAAADDDDDNYALQFAAFQMNRVLLEQASGNPLFNFGELIQIMEKPVVGVNTIKELIDLGEMVNFSETYERGMYADKSHGLKWAIRRTPFRSLYEAQFPEMKNKFMKIVLDSPIYDLLKDKDEDEEVGIYNWFKAILQNDASIHPNQAMDKAIDIN